MKTLTIFTIVLALALLTANICAQVQWQTIQGGMPNYHYYNEVVKSGTDTLLLAGFTGIYKSTNKGSNWTQVHNSINFKKISMFGNSGLAVSEQMYYTLRTTNGGNSWFTVNQFNTYYTGHCISLQMIDDNTAIRTWGYSYNTYNWLYFEKTTNGGYNWTTIGLPSSPQSIHGSFFVNENTGYISFNGQFLKTTDGGVSWNARSSGSYSKIKATGSDNIFAIRDGALVKSTNDGANWNIILNGDIRGYDVLGTNLIITVFNNGTIKRTTDGGNNWIQDITNISTPLESVCIVDNTSAVTVGNFGTILKYDNLTGVSATGTEISSGFMLSQNYPNPFNPSTKISFSLPKASFVKMAVYDVTGKEVESLVSENLNAGSYEVDFNASKLTSGVYFCRITADGFTDVKKMILAK